MTKRQLIIRRGTRLWNAVCSICFFREGRWVLWQVFFILCPGTGYKCPAQNVNNTGALYVISGKQFVSGGNFTNQSGSSLSNSGNMKVNGVYVNNGNYSGTGTLILSSTTNDTINNNNQAFNDLEISGSGTKVLGDTLIVNGNLTISSALGVSANNYPVNIKGNWVDNGAFNAGTGSVTFNGSTAQSLSGSNTFYDLTLNNSAGLSVSSGLQNIKSTLTLSSGTFTTNDSLALFSDASGTARVAPIAAGANISGKIRMQRYINAGATGWHCIAPPVSGMTAADWDAEMSLSILGGNECCAWPGPFQSIRYYDETVAGAKSEGYAAVIRVDSPIVPGRGYFVYTGTGITTTDPFTFDSRGPANTFAQSLTVNYTSSGLPDDDGWNLVANPYPSPIDWDAPTGWTKTSIANGIYIWDPDLEVWASYVGGVGSNGGTRYIASSQAFWVKATVSAPVLTTGEDVKSSNNPTYFKMSNSTNMLSLKISAGNRSDETVIRFLDSATVLLDYDYDAYKISHYKQTPYSNFYNSIAPYLATLTPDSHVLSINALPLLDGAIAIPLRAMGIGSGYYTISVNYDLLPKSACVTLEDKLTGVFTNLRIIPSYTFYMQDTTYAPRFALHIDAPQIEKRDVTCGSMNDGRITVAGHGNPPWSYYWLNSAGDTIRSTPNSSASDSMTGLAPGTYTVYVYNPGAICSILSEIIIVSEPPALSASANITHLLCAGAGSGSVKLSVSGGILPYIYLWNTGDTQPAIYNLQSAIYNATITDFNGCAVTVSTMVSEPPPIDITPSLQNISCHGNTDGSVSLSVAGGAPPYSYLWSNGENQPAVGNLQPAIYYVTITDANGCTQTASTLITEPPMVTAAFYVNKDTVSLEEGGSVHFINTSLGASTFTWDFGDGTLFYPEANVTHIYSAPGHYAVTLIASNGNITCSDTAVGAVHVTGSTGIGITAMNSSITMTTDEKSAFVHFNLSSQTPVKISLSNIIGQQVAGEIKTTVQQRTLRVDMSSLADGMYLLSASMDVKGKKVDTITWKIIRKQE